MMLKIKENTICAIAASLHWENILYIGKFENEDLVDSCGNSIFSHDKIIISFFFTSSRCPIYFVTAYFSM